MACSASLRNRHSSVAGASGRVHEASGRERQACGIHCTILAHISECYVSRLYIRIVQLRPDKITERKSGSPYSGFTHYPHHFIGLVSDAMQSQKSAGRALTSGADCKTIRTKNDVARPSPPNASKTPRLRMLGSLTLATCRCRAATEIYLLTYLPTATRYCSPSLLSSYFRRRADTCKRPRGL